MFETTRMPLQSDVFAAIAVVDGKDPTVIIIITITITITITIM